MLSSMIWTWINLCRKNHCLIRSAFTLGHEEIHIYKARLYFAFKVSGCPELDKWQVYKMFMKYLEEHGYKLQNIFRNHNCLLHTERSSLLSHSVMIKLSPEITIGFSNFFCGQRNISTTDSCNTDTTDMILNLLCNVMSQIIALYDLQWIQHIIMSVTWN